MKILTKPEKSRLSSSLIYGYELETGHLDYWFTDFNGADYYTCEKSIADTCYTRCLYVYWPVNGWHTACGN